MSRTLIENLFYSMYADEPDNAEIMYYWNTLLENITLFSAPEHTADEVQSHFYGLMSGLCRAQELQGFSNGVAFGLKLAAECTVAPPITTFTAKAAEEAYKSDYRAEVRAAEVLRAKKDTTRKGENTNV